MKTRITPATVDINDIDINIPDKPKATTDTSFFHRPAQLQPVDSGKLAELPQSATQFIPLKKRSLRQAFSNSPVRFCLIKLGKFLVPKSSRPGIWLENKNGLLHLDRKELYVNNMKKISERLKLALSVDEHSGLFRDCGISHKVTKLAKKTISAPLSNQDLSFPKVCSSVFKKLIRDEDILSQNDMDNIISVFKQLKQENIESPEKDARFIQVVSDVMNSKTEFHNWIMSEAYTISKIINEQYTEGSQRLDSKTFVIAIAPSFVAFDNPDLKSDQLAQINKTSQDVKDLTEVFIPMLKALNTINENKQASSHGSES